MNCKEPEAVAKLSAAVAAAHEARLGRALLPPTVGAAVFGVGGAAATMGWLLLGPPGLLVSGVAVLGAAAAGAAAGDFVGAERRPLTPEEKAEARRVFGDSLDLERVRVAGAPVLGIGRIARTLPGRIFFPLKSFQAGPHMSWLIHELTHAWQYQQGLRVHTLLRHALKGKAAYEYGGEDGLRQALAEGKRFTDFNTEQQGDILRHYYQLLAGERSDADIRTWEPFVEEVRRTRPKR